MKQKVSAPRAFLRGIPITVWMLLLVIVPLAFTFLMSFYSTKACRS